MKPKQQSEYHDDQLRSVLREWVVEAPLPPRFQEQVWQRIAVAQAQPAPGLWAGLSRRLDAALPRPKVAFSYMATLLVLGLAAGSVAAQIRTSHLNTALSERYVQSIDPYRAESPQP